MPAVNRWTLPLRAWHHWPMSARTLWLPVVFCAACASSAPVAPATVADVPDTFDVPDLPGIPDVADFAAMPDLADTPDSPDTADVARPYAYPIVDRAAYVDPFIGTGGGGNALVAALVPHGMVRAGPDNNGGDGRIDAYDRGGTTLQGFTHTNLQGPGGSKYGYSHVLVMPRRLKPPDKRAEWTVPMASVTESAAPGRYDASYDGLTVGLTATGHAAVHRIVTTTPGRLAVLVDLVHNLGDARGQKVTVVDGRTLSGTARYNVHPLLELLIGEAEPTGNLTLHTWLRASVPWKAATLREGDGAPASATQLEGSAVLCALDFGELPAGAVVELQVGLSLIDVMQAERNVRVEVGTRTFDAVAAAARALWNDRLSRLDVAAPQGSGPDLRKPLYTALYRTFMQPVDLTEPGETPEEPGRFMTAFTGEPAVFSAAKGRRYYTDDWCAWDTYRTSHPLRTLTEPEMVDDLVWSYLHAFTQGGWMDKCPWMASGFSRVMTGNPQVVAIADFIRRGFAGFEVGTAYAAMRKAAFEDLPNTLEAGGCGYLGLGTPAGYRAKGFVSIECDGTQSASMTFEYGHADAILAQVAAQLGHTDDATLLRERSKGWLQHWDPGTGFMRPKHDDGSWKTPFDPDQGDAASGFVESTAWPFLFAAQHDWDRLFTTLGGREAAGKRLDQAFAGNKIDFGNEPGFHLPFVYSLLGRPADTSRLAATLVLGTPAPPSASTSYQSVAATFTGDLPGNDDSGATSAWYVLTALGLYPITPGDPRWVLFRPSVADATLWLHPAFASGTALRVRRIGAGDTIASATLENSPITVPWIAHSALLQGGLLELQTANESAWGQDAVWGDGN